MAVSKADAKVRMAAIEEDRFPMPSTTEKLPADPKDRVGFSVFVTDGRVPFQETVDRVYEETNRAPGTDDPPPQ